MGIACSRFIELALGYREEYRVLILGLPGSGKTTILNQIRQLPSAGLTHSSERCEKFRIPGSRFSLLVIDVAHVGSLEYIDRRYLKGISGVLFVIDSADKDQFHRIEEELNLFQKPKGLPFVLIVNKQDVPGAHNCHDVEYFISLPRVLRDHPWKLKPIVATTGDGLLEALSEMTSMCVKFKGII